MITDNANTDNTNTGDGAAPVDAAADGTLLTPTPGDETLTPTPTFQESLGVKNELLNDFTDADSLAQAYLDKQTEFEEFKATVPTVPESPEQYTFEGEGAIDEGAMGEFQKLAHENGIPLSAFQKIVEFDIARQTQQMEALEAAENQQIDTLRGEWKNKFDSNIELSRQAVKHFGGEPLAKYLDESRLGNNIEMIKMFFNIQSLIGEDGLHSGQGNNPIQRPTMEDGKPMLNFPSMQK